MSRDEKGYNGWANYATWRVMLDLFDGISGCHDDTPMTRTAARDYAEEIIEETSTEGMARDYALAFLDDVDWQEIVDAINEANDTPNPNAADTQEED